MKRTRTITWDDPRSARPHGEAMSGLDYLRAIRAGKLPRPPMAETMGIQLAELSEGGAVFVADPDGYHYNPIGVVHGGLAATLLDSAMSCAVHTTLEAGDRYTTLELKVNFVRAITIETGRIRAEGRVLHRGKTVATAEGRLVAERGDKLLAHGVTTCLLMPSGG